MTATRRRFLAVLALGGIVVSVHLVVQHVQFVNSGTTVGLCSLVRVFDCAATEGSAFSSVFGIPTASFGVLYFFILLTAALLLGGARPSKGTIGTESASGGGGGAEDAADRDTLRVLSLLTLVGLVSSIALASISGFVVGAFCAGCTLVYGITLAAAAVVVTGSSSIGEYVRNAIGGPGASIRAIGKKTPDGEIREGNPVRTAAICIVLFVIPVTFGAPLVFTGKKTASPVATELRERPVMEFEIRESSLAVGAPDAPIQIVMFVDFQCASCKVFGKKLREDLARFEGKYRLVYKHFPFSKECNAFPALLEAKINHPRACRLAHLAQVLGHDGIFWKFSEELHEAGGSKNHFSAMKALSAKVGMDLSEWIRRSDEAGVREQVAADIREGIEIGVMTLPKVYVNGRELEAAELENPAEVLEKVL